MSPIPWQDAVALFTAANLLPADRVEMPNIQFSTPEPPDLWVSLRDVGEAAGPIELGRRAIWLERGTVYFTVMAPAGTGTDEARDLAKNIATLFRDLGPRPVGVVYAGASIGSGQLSDETGAWWALEVSVFFKYQDVLTP
jgi:hypothetical protein